MSQDDVEIVRRAYDAFSRAGLDGLLEHFHPDVEYDVTAGIGPFAGMYHGCAAVRNMLADYLESWEYVRMEPEEIIQGSENRIVVVLRMRMRGKGSGAGVEARTTNVWTMRDGRATRIAVYNDKADALQAAGVSDPA
jgi:ketosteroid isomerase-like protein